MKIYLVRHGEAKAKSAAPDRPLTDRGAEDVARVARVVARVETDLTAVWHSEKLRARQTAQILEREIIPEEGASVREGLLPKDDPSIIRKALRGREGSVMLVGHLPHLSRVASLLLTGSAEREILGLGTASVAALQGAEDEWRLDWHLVPALTPAYESDLVASGSGEVEEEGGL